jgi:predicted enzyme related to lactoylglutathione lyase
VSIPANDVTRAKAFYQSAFGWEFKPSPDPTYTEETFAFFTTPTPILRGAIIKSSVPTANKPGVGIEFYVLVDNIEGAFEKAKTAGGSVVMEKVADGNHTLRGKVADTEGNVVGVLAWQMSHK